ncbi:MAG: ribulose-phosphate 3-epimerase [Saprospiraceae bacterium]|nr:ribulose-phosphate 3-epimerase [Saprospiraceae bacterium]
MKHLIAPSLLASDFGKLNEEIQLVNDSEADWLHFDVMDGHFVPNISFGFPILKAAKAVCTKPIDVHLMISNPELYVQRYIDAGADVVTVHVEACPHLHRVLQMIHEGGAKAGVALNPHTSVSSIEHVLEDLDLICLMSVNPGFGGQKFIYQTIPKIRELKARLVERNLNCHIEIDGGVGLQNAEQILKAGATVLVAGSAVFRSDNPRETIKELKHCLDDTILA